MPSDAPDPHLAKDSRQRARMAAVAGLPRAFGRYVLFEFIGKGGMAEIFLARATTSFGAARLCVVKQILPEYVAHPEFEGMLVHEAKLAARLNHANIVQVFDLGRAEEHFFIAMEYVEGFDLNALLRLCSKSKTPLPLDFSLLVVTEALRGLDYAHRRQDDEGRPLGIVHRDVSPSNVLLSLEGEVKLCDFGIARANDLVESKDAQVDEALKGKAGYMSPEHARGEAIDARADVFAAGIVLWELLAGKRMYHREKGGPPLLELARRAQVPELPRRAFPADDELRAVVAKALAVDREARYASAGAMVRALETYAANAKLLASPLRLGSWLTDHFGAEVLMRRRALDERPEADEASATRGVPSRGKALASPPPSSVRPAPSLPPPSPPTSQPASVEVPVSIAPGSVEVPVSVAAPAPPAASPSPPEVARTEPVVLARSQGTLELQPTEPVHLPPPPAAEHAAQASTLPRPLPTLHRRRRAIQPRVVALSVALLVMVAVLAFVMAHARG